MLPWAMAACIAVMAFCLGNLIVKSGRRRKTASGELAIDRTGYLAFGSLTRALAGVLPQAAETRKKVEREIKRAGFYRPMAREQFEASRNAMVIGWALLAGALIVITAGPDTLLTWEIAAVALVLISLSYALPRLWLQSQAAARVRRIQIALPDALDMMTMCLTGGLSLQSSLERVSKDVRTTHPDLGTELEIVRKQSGAHTLESALTQFAERIDVPEIKSLAAIVAQTERLGANVANAIRDFADGIRRGHRQRAEERGNATSVKMLLPVSLCLAPVVYILLLAPPLLEMNSFLTKNNREGGLLDPAEMNPAQLRGQRRPPVLGTTNVDTLTAESGN
jgi:tight adherence protein C